LRRPQVVSTQHAESFARRDVLHTSQKIISFFTVLQ